MAVTGPEPSVEGWNRDFRPLEGITVLEIGSAASVAVAGWVLGQLGAEVFVRDKPEVPTTATAVSEGYLRAVLSARKRLAPGGPEETGEILKSVRPDVVLRDLEVGARGVLELGWSPAFGEPRGPRVWVTISPFGLTGSKAGRPGHELTYLAASGLLSYTRGTNDELVVPAGFQASMAAGHIAALSVVHALSLLAEGRESVHMDVSIQEAVLSTSVPLEVAHALLKLGGEPGTKRYGPPRGLLECADGHVYLSVLEDHHWRGVKAALGNPTWAAGIETVRQARENGVTIAQELKNWASTRTRDEIVVLMQENGVPATGVMSCTELLADEDNQKRGYFETSEQSIRLPSVPFLARGSSFRREPNWQSLRRCRVADLSHVLAGPLAASWLGAMGARVVRLEELHRLDIYRRLGPHPEGVARGSEDAIELAGYFAAVNHSKWSVAVSEEVADLVRARMVTAADVILENLSSHRRIQLGLDFDAVRETNKRALVISSSGFGRHSGRSDYRVYGTNLHCHCGIVYQTRDETGHVCNIGAAAWADPLTSIWIALIAAAGFVSQLQGIDVDISMAEVASRHLADHFALASVRDVDLIETERPPYTITPCRDGQMVIVLRHRDDLECLATWLQKNGGMQTVAGNHRDWKKGAHALLRDVAAIVAGMGSEQVESELGSLGVPAQKVLDAYDLAADEHLKERGFFAEVPHRHWGTERIIGLPWRPAFEQPIRPGPTPLLGEHDSIWREDEAWQLR